MLHDSLCHFDLSDPVDATKAENYRKHEKPFVGFNLPEQDRVVEKWGDIEYLREKIGPQTFRTETSTDNHFMYWNGGGGKKKDKNWKPPTSNVWVTFDDWLSLAVNMQNKSLEERKHQYFRVTAESSKPRAKNKWVFDELEFFQPKKQLYIVDPQYQQGIHCRFGMRSIIAEAHFDRSRNSIAMMRGLRRWVLAPLSECSTMYILPKNHPSGRHSEVDWSQPDLESFPEFPKTNVHEVILQPGDILYIPTSYIHYIVSLNVNIQCNTRSGTQDTPDDKVNLKKCGF